MEINNISKSKQNLIILDVDSENEKVKNVLKKCLDQTNELQKRAFTYSYQKNFKKDLKSRPAFLYCSSLNQVGGVSFLKINFQWEVERKKINNISNSKQDCSDSLTHYLKFECKITISPWKTGGEPIECINATPGLRLAGKGLLIIQDILESKNDIKNGYKLELTSIKLYRSIIINETCRVMISIDMVASKANQLFGLEKTPIFFDLLDEKMFHFESPGIISEFVLNMALYAVRQYVISFFEHAGYILNNLMLSFLCCPDSESLQKMTEKEFTSLMLCVIDSSSLKTKRNKGAKPSLKVTKGIKWIMVASEEFVRAMGGEISEDVSDGREIRPIHSIYFPPDCRLFIYIPTENGSFWHRLDMQRARRMHQ